MQIPLINWNWAVCTFAALSAFSSSSFQSCGDKPVAIVNEGPVQGYYEPGTGHAVFLGVPFGASTAGVNRWRAPQPVVKRTEVLQATSYGHSCPQANLFPGYAPQGEDCLNLNIWAPKSGRNHNVMVYFFGGAMVYGGNSHPNYNGTHFPKDDIVVVTANYRSNLFGAPHSPEQLGESTNFGVLDVFAAIDWVQKNIAAFGGDPTQITIFGQSSGGVMVDYYLWNHPDTTIKAAIIQSATVFSGPNYAPLGVGLDALSSEVGCPPHAEGGQLACLRTKSLSELLTENFNSTYTTWFTPTIDNHTRFQDYPARFAAGKFAKHVPALIGNTHAEGTFFGEVVYPASQTTTFSHWINTYNADAAHIPDTELLLHYNLADYPSSAIMAGALYANLRFYCAIDQLNDVRASETQTWMYRWMGDYPASGLEGLGATHGSELPYTFGGNFANMSKVDTTAKAVAESTHKIWVNFAKDPKRGPGWERSSPQNGTIGLLGVAGKDTDIVLDWSGNYNGICQNFQNLWQGRYPVQIDPRAPGSY